MRFKPKEHNCLDYHLCWWWWWRCYVCWSLYFCCLRPHTISVSDRLFIASVSFIIPRNNFELFQFYNNCTREIAVASLKNILHDSFNQLLFSISKPCFGHQIPATQTNRFPMFAEIIWKMNILKLFENSNKIQHQNHYENETQTFLQLCLNRIMDFQFDLIEWSVISLDICEISNYFQIEYKQNEREKKKYL